MGLFTENTRVQVPAALHLCRLGYVYKTRAELVCDQKTNILVDEFMTAVSRINPGKDKSEIKTLLDNFISVSSNDDIGREFYEKITTTVTKGSASFSVFRERFLFLLRYGFAYVDRMIEQDDGTKIQKLELVK